MAIKLTKCHRNIYQHLPLHGPPKFIQIAIFGLKIYHLATLIASRAEKLLRWRFKVFLGAELMQKEAAVLISFLKEVSGS
jgi:hypothetical protein